MEEVLQSCKRAGLHVAVGLTYPCPLDDYHTHAETLRLLQRCKPGSVHVAPPEPEEGSLWLQRAPAYQFRADWTRHGKWAGARDLRPAWLPPAALFLPYRMSGWSVQRIAQEHGALCEDVAALGIAQGLSPSEVLLAELLPAPERRGYLDELRRELYCFDTRSLEELLGRFNDAASTSTNTVRFRPFTPVLAAVGN